MIIILLEFPHNCALSTENYITLRQIISSLFLFTSEKKRGFETMDAYKSDSLPQSVEIALTSGSGQIPQSLFVAR